MSDASLSLELCELIVVPDGFETLFAPSNPLSTSLKTARNILKKLTEKNELNEK